MICQKCNATIPDKAVFCPECGNRVEAPVVQIPEPEDRTVRVRRAKPETVIPTDDRDRTTQVRRSKPQPEPQNPVEDVWKEEPVFTKEKPAYMINFISLALLMACIALWVLLPFMAVNLDTLSAQPTALEVLLDDVSYTGQLADALAFWMAIAAIAGVVLCLACVVLKSRIVTRILAALSAGTFVVSIVSVAKWAVDIREFFEFFGIAFWGILVLLAGVAVLGGSLRKKK